MIDCIINMTIFVYFPVQRFKGLLFLKLPEGRLFSKSEITDNANSLLNLAETKF